jgi:hypothetical protein
MSFLIFASLSLLSIGVLYYLFFMRNANPAKEHVEEPEEEPEVKPKKEKKESVKHDCYGCTSKGTPCAAAATVEVGGHWFCWRHEEAASEIIASKEPKEVKQVKKPIVEKKAVDSFYL